MSNGLSADAFVAPEPTAISAFASRLPGRTVLAKMARWDPDKRWLGAIDIVAELKRLGARPLPIARGGAEAHGDEVLARARSCGLSVCDRGLLTPGGSGLLAVLETADEADLLVVRSPIDSDARRLLFRGADAVLANSRHEPFGLVALEVMAVGGIACTGTTGEDYCLPGHNAIALQTNDPREFAWLFSQLKRNRRWETAMRRAGLATAHRFEWRHVIERTLLPRLEMLVS